MNAPLLPPDDDKQFEETTLTKVDHGTIGWSVTQDNGWSFFIEATSPVEPKVGSKVRLYGAGIGSRIRGVVLDGTLVYYRSPSEDEEYSKNQLYGATIEEWLERWDSGRTVWSISMGGLGPGYEQAIQVTVAEIIRHMIAEKYAIATWEDDVTRKRDITKIEAWSFKHEPITKLGLSGAMWGAAQNLASMLYRHGPVSVMKDERVKDRHIQVSKNFP